MDTDEKSQKAWISHFVGNWLVQAHFETGQGKSARTVRDELVAKLESRASGTLVNEVKGLIAQSEWSDEKQVQEFTTAYHQFEKKYGMGS